MAARSAIAGTFVEVLALSRKQIIRWPFTEGMMDRLRAHTVAYPEDTETQKNIDINLEWTK